MSASCVMPTLVQFGLTVTMSAAVIAKGKSVNMMTSQIHSSPGQHQRSSSSLTRSHSSPSLDVQHAAAARGATVGADADLQQQKSVSNYCLNCKAKLA